MVKIIIGLVIALAVMIGGNYLLPVPRAAISVAAEPIGVLGLTNSLLTSIILSLIIIIGAIIIGRNLKEAPGGLQNVVELLIEGLDGLVTSIAPKKWAATFFPIVATIFIYLLFANWFSLLTPLLGSFGIIHPAEPGGGGISVDKVWFVAGSPESLRHEGAEESGGEASEGESGSGQEVLIVPLFRAPSSDLNLTFALALISVVLTQVFGIRERGIGYFGNFIRLNAFAKQGFLMGLIDFIVGLIEGVSEIAKIISFSFRLFGNIFAGEVLMIVISYLVSFLLIIVFFGFEIFVGVVQAFVFFILSLVFFTLATQHHGEEH
ncbi:MAG: F0F1 ATP synthase subunit A [Chloroflexi bacterium]|nr:F0F1 ATP synthase subunit A [Chloroflexota bacterium]